MNRKSAQNAEEEDYANREFLKGKDLSRQDDVGRPPVPSLNERTDKIEFMQIDCDYYTERAQNQVRQESK